LLPQSGRENIMKSQVRASVGAVLSIGAFVVTQVQAAEIKFLCVNALKTTIEEVAPRFEKASGSTLAITFGSSPELAALIDKGAPFDFVMLPGAGLDDFVRKGKLTARVDLVRSSIGVAIRRGAAKPDLGTVEGFKRMLLAAKSIAYGERSPTGLHLAALLPRLGIAEELKAKTRLLNGPAPAEVVAKGEVEIAMTQVSEILPYAGVELAGTLPAEIALVTDYGFGASAATREGEAVKALVGFLKSAEVAQVIRAKGLEPR
jgi:molybdate transport system substrate-binding protein